LNDKFIIVIEADNKRAHAAYLKGLEDLERIWPQIVEWAAITDEASEKRYKQKDEEEAAEQARCQAAVDSYKDQMKTYNSSIFGGKAPDRPYLEEARLDSEFRLYKKLSKMHRTSALETYVSTREDLQHMANVAGAAIGPFRMTEYQVKAMVSWEDGSTIDKIKARIA
jgi:hypothetical protein